MIDVATLPHAPLFLGVLSASIALSACLAALLLPWLRTAALVRPTDRSSHRIPTPQGGGAAVVIATLAVTWVAIGLTDVTQFGSGTLFAVTVAAVVLASLGAADDLYVLTPLPRLIVQSIVLGLLLASLPIDLRVLPETPWWIERALLLVGGLWFINLVNFMDGIDWMTVAEAVPVSAALAIAGMAGLLPFAPTLLALALLGAILGFAPFNRPVAKLFLGDVGSLPIGLLLGWLLLQMAAAGYWAATALLPLYYLADATLTLLRRVAAGHRIWEPHRTHFYQIATERGFSVLQVTARVFGLNVALAGLALASTAASSALLSVACLALGVGLVTWTLVAFTRGKRPALPR